MRVRDLTEWGRIVKGVNTTPDVGTNEIPRQAKKFGNTVDKDGRPPTLSKKVKGKSTNVLFNLGLAEGYKLKLERDENIDVLHIVDTKTKKRIEVRGKKNYETNYDPKDKLHQVLDKVGKAANISELMNGEVVGINPKHPKGADAEKTAKDVLQTEANEIGSSTEIFVDMDGVLADFFTAWAKLMGAEHWTKIEDIPSALEKIKQTENFWLDLPLTSNAKNLLMLIKDIKGEYSICSSPLPGDPNSEPHKLEWIEKNLNFFPPKDVIITHDKAKYATTEDGTPNILIDDYGVNIQKWEAAGGIGFKHKDHKFERTAKNIKQHMQEPVEERELTKAEIKKRDKTADKIMDKPKAKKGIAKWAKDKGMDPEDAVYAIATNMAKEALRSGRYTPDQILEILENFADGRKNEARTPRMNPADVIAATKASSKSVSQEELQRIVNDYKSKPPNALPNLLNKVNVDTVINIAMMIGAPHLSFLQKFLVKKGIKFSRNVMHKALAQVENIEENFADGRKNEGAEITMWTNPEYQGADVDDKYYEKQPVKIVDISKLTPFEPADKMNPKDNHDNMMKFVDKIIAGKKIKPIVIVPYKGKGLIVDGHHRYFAHIKAGVDKIRAVIADPKDLTWRDDVPESIKENFADGKKKGKSRPGRVKKSGASCKGSVTSLRKKAKNASGEKAKMYHWCANMKSGRNKQQYESI